MRFWGRTNKYGVDEVTRREPLVLIPKEHWNEYRLELLTLFKFNNRGTLVGVHEDNMRAFTRHVSKGQTKESFVDVHVNSGEAGKFLKANGYG